MTFTKLLVPIAPDQEIDERHHQAFRFADQCSAKVTLLLVIKELAEFKEIYRLSGSSLDILDKATKHFKQSLAASALKLADQYPHATFEAKVRVGKPFIEILEEAEESRTEMIIINSYRQNKQEACERGSNTLNLMRKSERPIWSLSRVPAAIENVAVALDLTNTEFHDFNTEMLAKAVEFCSVLGAKLTVCHVWKLESEGLLRRWSSYSDLDIALLAKNIRTDRIERLNSLIEVHKGSCVEIDTQVLEGEVREVFPRFVTNNHINLVMLGSLSRSGLSGFFLGNTAESMVNQLDCSVITLKPD